MPGISPSAAKSIGSGVVAQFAPPSAEWPTTRLPPSGSCAPAIDGDVPTAYSPAALPTMPVTIRIEGVTPTCSQVVPSALASTGRGSSKEFPGVVASAYSAPFGPEIAAAKRASDCTESPSITRQVNRPGTISGPPAVPPDGAGSASAAVGGTAVSPLAAPLALSPAATVTAPRSPSASTATVPATSAAAVSTPPATIAVVRRRARAAPALSTGPTSPEVTGTRAAARRRPAVS